jgi:hypothetical protein
MNNYEYYKIFNGKYFLLLKTIFIILIVLIIYLLISIQKVIIKKFDIKSKYLNKIAKLEAELNSMKILDSHNYKLLNRTLLKLNQEFESNLLNKINEIYSKNKIVNINQIEASIKGGRKWVKNENKSNEINLGFQLDPGYILRTMMTLASIIDSQSCKTKIRLHFAVVLNFTAENMTKIYSLREKIRDDVEFNFYNAEKVEKDFKGVHPKGPGAIAKIILPHLLPDDIDRIILFDTGDLLVLRDLREMYNWNMRNYLYLGAPDPCIGKKALISKKPYDVYINIGHFLLNVKKIKEKNMYQIFLKNKNAYKNIIADQDLMNDVAQKKIGYLPVRFGLFSPFLSDKDSDDPKVRNQYEYYKMTKKKLKNKFPYIPKNTSDFFRQSYNPVVIHQWNGKWAFGGGLSIYRRLATCYMKIACVYDELCKKIPLYCKK